MKEQDIPHIAIAGNPNSGKSTVFNALTGLRQKVANYPGKTVEKHIGVLLADGPSEEHVIDLPGTYSLNWRSPDEQIAHDVLMGWDEDTPPPRVIVAVVDASNLERNLYFVSQLLSLGRPVVVALNMMDACRKAGIDIDVAALERRIGVQVVPTVASEKKGIRELEEAIRRQLEKPAVPADPVPLPPAVAAAVDHVASEMTGLGITSVVSARGEALRTICTEQSVSHPRFRRVRDSFGPVVETVRRNLAEAGLSWYAVEAEARYAWVDSVIAEARTTRPQAPTLGERADRWLTHRVFGPLSLAAIVLAIFVAIFTFARPAMDLIAHLFGLAASAVVSVIPAGPLQSLLTDGVIAGVGAILTFLPQIMLLFLFIAALEDSGYTPRAALIMDRIMGKVGLHGKAFIPLFSSFACAVPGVMATRLIDNAKDRLLTILVAPFMCCYARWPVYLLLAGTVIPGTLVLGFIPLPALVLAGMILLGIVAAAATAALFNRTLLKGGRTTLAMELPRYRRPRLRMVLHIMWERSVLFIRKAGTVILAMSVIMWALASYPRRPGATPEQQVRHSFAGAMGRAIEPAIAPIGFDWRIGVAVISSFVAREVFVSSLATLYGVSVTDPHNVADLQTHLRAEKDPTTGRPFFTPLRGLCIMLFYVLSMQCVSTMAVVRRETGSWKWMVFQWAYMAGLAWASCFVLWQAGHLMGWS